MTATAAASTLNTAADLAPQILIGAAVDVAATNCSGSSTWARLQCRTCLGPRCWRGLFATSWQIALVAFLPVPVIAGGSLGSSGLPKPRYARVRERVADGDLAVGLYSILVCQRLP